MRDFAEVFPIPCPLPLQGVLFSENTLFIIKQFRNDFRIFTYDCIEKSNKEVPLLPSHATSCSFHCKFTSIKGTSKHLIFKITLKSRNSELSGEKFCIYDKTNLSYLWESEKDETYLDAVLSEQSTYIFSHLSKNEISFTIRARDIQTGEIVFDHTYEGTLKSHVCSLSGILSIEYENTKSKEPQFEIVSIEKDNDGKITPRQTTCFMFCEIDFFGNYIYIEEDGLLSFVMRKDAQYEKHTLQTPWVGIVFFANNAIFSSSETQITKIGDEQFLIDCQEEIYSFKKHDKYLIVGLQNQWDTCVIYDLETGNVVSKLSNIYIENIFECTEHFILSYDPHLNTVNIHKILSGAHVNSIKLPGQYRNLTYQDGLLLYQYISEYKTPERFVFIDFNKARKWPHQEKSIS